MLPFEQGYVKSPATLGDLPLGSCAEVILGGARLQACS